MIEAYLAGHVPHAVMADWCDEQGLVFPRSPPVVVHRRRGTCRCTLRKSESGCLMKPGHLDPIPQQRRCSLSSGNRPFDDETTRPVLAPCISHSLSRT